MFFFFSSFLMKYFMKQIRVGHLSSLAEVYNIKEKKSQLQKKNILLIKFVRLLCNIYSHVQAEDRYVTTTGSYSHPISF